MFSYTCTAPVNIAVIKYWGKRDKERILPINGSLSASLDQAQLRAKTTVMASKAFTSDRMWLNGEEQELSSPRLQSVLKEIRRRARKRKISDDNGDVNNVAAKMYDWHVHICSENNFPTAAGLASSAAGYACLAFSLAKLYGIEDDVSLIARQGSGSACRSVYGGFVEWCMGALNDGSDSIAQQVAPDVHWPEMRILILVVSAKKKHVSSAAGMETSVKTSRLLKHRAEQIVPDRLEKMKKAIQERDFATFAELTMKDSNEMHACCLDTYPPISYMTDVSRQIQTLIHHINAQHTKPIVAYTFDAGPNACLYLLEEHISEVLAYIQHCYCPETTDQSWITGLPYLQKTLSQEESGKIPIATDFGAVQYVIHTKVGPGPQILEETESLLDQKGLPKTVNGEAAK